MSPSIWVLTYAGVDMDADDRTPVSWATVAGYAMLGVVLFGWFLHGMFVERQGLVESMGESLGSAVTALLIVSIVASFRKEGPPP